jgi:hypothetical protein
VREEAMAGATQRSETTVRSAVDDFLSSPRLANVNTARAYAAVLDRVASDVGTGQLLAEVSGDDLAEVVEREVEDEQRHHRIIGEIATAIGEGIAWRNDADTVRNMPQGKPLPNLEEVTKRFLAAERADRKQLRTLRKELRPFRDTTMWSLLVEVMELDTAKHILLLTFIRDHLTRGSG